MAAFGTADKPTVLQASSNRAKKPPEPDTPTILFYNHYDVQPAEPLDLWESDPFTLTIRDDKAFARGAADDKGHIVSRLLALDAVREANGGHFPFHVKFLVFIKIFFCLFISVKI